MIEQPADHLRTLVSRDLAVVRLRSAERVCSRVMSGVANARREDEFCENRVVPRTSIHHLPREVVLAFRGTKSH
jgi:hypothetical protein